jgi:tetratricopeptide (TPR) repeat protein
MILVFLISEKYLTAELTPFRIIVLISSIVAVALFREVGISLILAAVVFYFFVRQRMIVGLIILVAGGLSGLWYLRNHLWIGQLAPSQEGNLVLYTQHYFTQPDSPLINELALRMWERLHEYFFQIAGMLIYPLFVSQQFKLNVDPSQFHQLINIVMTSFGKFIILILTIPMILFGIYLDIKKSKVSVLRILFGTFYLILVLLYPAHDIRFLLPLLPFLIYYCILSIRWGVCKMQISEKYSSPKYIVVGLLFLMLPNLSGIYEILKINTAYRESPVIFYERLRRLPTYPLMFTQPWSLMGKWICENLPDSIVIASPSKELATVVGNRKVLELDQSSVLPTFETLLRDNHVDYILTTIRREDFNVFEFFLLESKRFHFDSVYKVANLYLLRVRSKLREYLPTETSQPSITDTLKTAYLLRKGRSELLAERYESAARIFKKALATDSTLPEIYYQTIIAYSMIGDSTAAKFYFQKLFTLPQALGYVGNARMQLQAMQMLAKAQSESFPASKAVGSFNVASLYWKLGYYKRAASVMNAMLDIDTTYFIGLLWGMHFNLQNGDTAMAKKYLAILENIERGNPVVNTFINIMRLGDSLSWTQLPNDKSRLHYEIGVFYKKIELNEETLDEAERALRDNPKNVDAFLLMAHMFERKSNLRMAERYYRQVISQEPQNMIAVAKLDSISHELLKR